MAEVFGYRFVGSLPEVEHADGQRTRIVLGLSLFGRPIGEKQADQQDGERESSCQSCSFPDSRAYRPFFQKESQGRFGHVGQGDSSQQKGKPANGASAETPTHLVPNRQYGDGKGKQEEREWIALDSERQGKGCEAAGRQEGDEQAPRPSLTRHAAEIGVGGRYACCRAQRHQGQTNAEG